ncbi:GT2 family glycosyltransferase [Curtobacterium sp. 320]|jgi:GT2 family glycosyltransferase|uniref:glycosyltransferase n=1 Tax=unclassified Curtobacterium TaxID=257496 RepID=UPI001E598F6B|nr:MULTISPECIES: glycosyltransferase [unclassified Curtobacterium]MCC8908834.1 glycosyltransferase [Curtobacterium sp. GD1]MCT9621046.1 glycosyltransferase [Curtobacterium sp. C2H10]MDR6574587.1 GT2 family glycosyltransferase [Curtobacterium sp. 320]
MATTSTARALPAPRRVIDVDLDAPLPRLVADGTGSSALVIGYRGGRPTGTLDVELTDDPADAARALGSLRETVLADVEPVPDALLPTISVVVSTVVDRVEDLGALLDVLEHLDYPDHEVIVVDNRVRVPADDRLPALLAGRGVRLVTERRPGLSAGRNAGVAAARGEVVAFTDDDVRVDPQWLRALGARFVREADLDAVSGVILPTELSTPAQIWYEAYYGGFSGERTFAPVTIVPDDVAGTMRHARVQAVRPDGSVVKHFAVYGIGAYGAGANMAFRRSVIDAVGGFDTTLGAGSPARGGEDLAMFIETLWRGGRIGFEPRAVVHHRHRQSIEDLHKQLHGNGVGFTALMCALAAKDRRHVAVLARLVPAAAMVKLRETVGRLRTGSAPAPAAVESAPVGPAIPAVPDAGVPRSLAYHELRGFPAGPAAWFRSRRRWRDVEAGRFHAG